MSTRNNTPYLKPVKKRTCQTRPKPLLVGITAMVIVDLSPPCCEGFNVMSKIGEIRLYLGDKMSAMNVSQLKASNISLIINVSETIPNYCPDIEYLNVRIADDGYLPIKKELQLVADRIQKEIMAGGSVLVHCECGISRSSTFIIAYKILKENKTFDEAFDEVRKCRQCIDPNYGFCDQLYNLALQHAAK